MVNIVYIQNLKSYVVKRDERFFILHINIERFNAREPKIGDNFLSCVSTLGFVKGRTEIVPKMKLIVEKKDGTKVSDGFLYRLIVSEEWLNKMVSNNLVKLSEIHDITSIYYSDLWKFEDEIIVSAGIGNNLSVTSVRDYRRRTLDGFISFEKYKTPQTFKYSGNIVTIDRHGKDLKILVDGVLVEEVRMKVSSIYNNKYLDFK